MSPAERSYMASRDDSRLVNDIVTRSVECEDAGIVLNELETTDLDSVRGHLTRRKRNELPTLIMHCQAAHVCRDWRRARGCTTTLTIARATQTGRHTQSD